MKASERLGAASSFSGLSSRRQLINQATGRATGRPSSAVHLDQLAHNPFNPREELTSLEETIASLQEKGQLTALTVVTREAFLTAHPDQDDALGDAEWVVLDGNRRLAAAHQAGLQELRIDVNDTLAATATDLLENALLANLHRIDLPPMDEAKVIRDLVKIHGSQGKVAKRLSKSAAWVSQRLALLNLSPDLQEKVETGKLKVEPARRIGRMAPEQQAEAAAEAITAAAAPKAPRQRPAPAEPESAPVQEPQSVNAVKTPDTGKTVNAVNTEAAPASTVQVIELRSPEQIATDLTRHLPGDQLSQLTELLLEHSTTQ